MKDAKEVELVHLHAEALNEGRDIGHTLTETLPQSSGLADLFGVAGKLKSALRPVEASAHFAAEFRQQLVRHARALTKQREEEHQQRLLWFAVGVGSVVYVVGLFVASARFAWWLIGIAGFLIGWRRRPLLAKAHQTVR